MVQSMKAPVTKPDDLSSILRTHVVETELTPSPRLSSDVHRNAIDTYPHTQ